MRITATESTHLFVGTVDDPVQILAVEVRDGPGRRVQVSVDGGSPVAATVADDGSARVEVPVRCVQPVGTRVPVRVRAVDADQPSSFAVLDTELEVTEPGWTMYLVSHFHYDPVWWNTQGAYTATWDAVDADRPARTFDSAGSPAFTLLRAHLDLALRDPDYTFVLAEIDYLKPFWDAHPEQRAVLRRLLAEDRLEIMGGTYNEPSTAISSAESTVRNAIHGAGYQRDILGADPSTAWQLDVFGHDAQFPGLMAAAGLTSSSWARGPFHQWGPSMRRWGDGPHPVEVMQFPAEFAWISPSGGSLLTAFQTHHYMSGWRISGGTTLAEAEELTYRQFLAMRPAAATRNVLLPVGGDYAPPCAWVPQIHRDWNHRYVSPRFVSGLPSEFFAAVRVELDSRGVAPSPQTRDMNPVYTGTAVSYTDVRQAQRRGETLLGDAEMWATLAGLATGAGFPAAAVDKAWRQLLYGAHHDAVTGSPSDQVYLDLLTGWREVVDVAAQVHADATTVLAAQVGLGSGRDVVVFNPSSWSRTDVLALPDPGGIPVDDGGTALPAVLVDGVLHVVVPEVPGVGLRTVALAAAEAPRWTPLDGTTIGNDAWEVAADPARGGGVHRLYDKRGGRDLLAEGGVGCELTVQAEYATHPYYGEGPWHLLPTGEFVSRSRDVTATVTAQSSPAGQRLVVTGDLGVLRYRHELTLWRGVDRLEITTTVDGFTGADQLIRVRWPSSVRDGLPVAEIADAVIGKDLGFPDVDVREHPWTLDQPAQTWFALGATAVVEAGGSRRPIGVAELVFDDERAAAELGTGLAVAFVQAGVTATTTLADGPRYGALEIDSNLPDVRVVVGVLGRNAVLDALVDEPGTVWLPAARPLREHWTPDADLRGLDTLPVLVVAAADEESLRGAVAALIDDLADAVITVPGERSAEDWDGSSLAVLNRGTPSFTVDVDGVLTLSLQRSCTGWPSGFWVDPPKRTTPDGSSFQLGHWTHTFHHALVGGTGDWRGLDLPRAGHAYNHPLTAVVREAGTGADGPRTARLLTVTPDDRVLLDAVKPAGNPLARGLSDTPDARDGVVVRMHETTGAPVTATIGGAWCSAETVDLLEGNPRTVDPDPADSVEIGAFGITTARLVPAERAADGAALAAGSHREPAQPVFTRYWLHNAGPAPRGNQPVGVFLDPPSTLLRHGRTVTASVRVSSEVRDRVVDGTVTLRAPQGWTIDRPTIPYALGPAGFLVTDVTATAPGDAAPGRYWLVATITHGGQEFTDATALDVPHPDGRVDGVTAGLYAEIGVAAVDVAGTAEVPVVVRNTSADAMTGALWVLSPQETWNGVGPACHGVELGPGQSTTLIVGVDGAAIPPGEYWLGVKIAAHGEPRYSATVAMRVTR